jgi:hypothetical protein
MYCTPLKVDFWTFKLAQKKILQFRLGGRVTIVGLFLFLNVVKSAVFSSDLLVLLRVFLDFYNFLVIRISFCFSLHEIRSYFMFGTNDFKLYLVSGFTSIFLQRATHQLLRI